MFPSNARIAVITLAAAAALLGAPLESEGGLFDWLCPSSWCEPAPPVTTYSPAYSVQRVSLMPVAAAPYVAYSPVAQTCYYAPQTTFRWTYSRISRTQLQPVTAVDPCTGCPTMAYQPVTRRTLLPWLHREPVTSYRLVCSPACPPACTTVGAPSATVLGSPCCPAPVTTVPGPITGVPSVDPGYAPPSTFRTEPGTGYPGPTIEGTQRPQLDLRPDPDLNTNPTSLEQPRLIMPSVKTAARPILEASYHPATAPVSSAGLATPVGLDVSGWRASHD